MCGKRKIMKYFSNFRVKDPLERSINNICKDMHKAVCKAFEEGSLTAVFETIDISKDVPGKKNGSPQYTVNKEATVKSCKDQFIQEAKDYYALASAAVKRYKKMLEKCNYHFHVSEVNIKDEAFFSSDYNTDYVTSYRYVGHFFVNIILEDSTKQEKLDNLISTMNKKEW